MSNTDTGCAAVFDGVRCGAPKSMRSRHNHSQCAPTCPGTIDHHTYLAPRTVTQQVIDAVKDGVTGEALGRTETERCTFPGCGHTRTIHAYGDCLMRPCAAGSHYFNPPAPSLSSSLNDRENE